MKDKPKKKKKRHRKESLLGIKNSKQIDFKQIYCDSSTMEFPSLSQKLFERQVFFFNPTLIIHLV